LFLFGGTNTSSIVAVVSILTVGLISGIVVSRIEKYRNRWIAFVVMIISVSSISMFSILDKKNITVIPYLYSILVVSSCFLAYLLRYLVNTNNQQCFVKENEERFRNLSTLKDAVFNSASEVSIIVTDCEGFITIFNQGKERMLGYSAEEMVGKKTPLILHLESEVRIRNLLYLSAIYGEK
jgi:PAS domain-containing protein